MNRKAISGRMSKKLAFTGIFVLLGLVGLLTLVFPFRISADIPGNLVLNPSFDVASTTGNPDHWIQGGFGISTTTFSYPVEGFSGPGDKAVSITISNYQSGDAKWIFEEVPVVPGYQYTYSDKYKSDVKTELVTEYFDVNHNHISFGGFAGVVSSESVWKSVSTDFIPPAGAAFMKVFHTLGSIAPNNGTLSIDDVSLVKGSEPIPFDQGIVSLTFDDGWSSQYNNAFLEMKKFDPVMPATFFIFTTPMHDSGRNLFTDAGATADMSTTINSNGVTWSPIYLEANQDYFISDNYTSDSESIITVAYTSLGIATTSTSEILPAGSNIYGAMTFHLTGPIDPGAVTISHKTTNASGILTVGSDKAMEEIASEYMGPAELREIQRGGSEIAVHTRDHCNLVFVEDSIRCAYLPNPNPSSLLNQIDNAQSDLLAENLSPADTIAYPYGSYNSVVQDFIRDGNKIIAGRGLDIGYNYKNTNKLALKVQVIDASTTPAQVEDWVNNARDNHSWLILVLHQIDSPAKILSNGEEGGTTPDTFKTIINYIHSQPVLVKTVHDVVTNLMSIDITPPTLENTPSDMTVYTNTDSPLIVSYTNPTATDNSPGVVIVGCVPSSGSSFAIGTTTVVCTATDSAPTPNSSTSSFNIGVVYVPTSPASTEDITILPGVLPDGVVGNSYNQTLSASTTASGPFTWSITSGALPGGLTLDGSSGVISGIASVNNQFSFSVFVTNSIASTTKSYNVNVAAASTPTPTPTPSNGGGGGGGGSYSVIPTVTAGLVLGASTSTTANSTNGLDTLIALKARLATLYKMLLTLQFQVAKCSYVWNTDLSQPMFSPDVKNLQIALNFSSLTEVVSTGGVSNRGFETTFFGGATKNAVIKFQNIFAEEILTPMGLTTGNGIVGETTRTQLNTLCSSN